MLLILSAACAAGCGRPPASHNWTLTSDHAQVVSQFQLLQVSLRHNGLYGNPFHDAAVSARFIAPDGRVLNRMGFYYGRGTWMVRLLPDQPGPWKYEYTFKSTAFRAEGRGAFTCTPALYAGPLRRDPANRHRFLTTNDRPWFPLGLQDCVNNEGAEPAAFYVDGELRNDNKARKLSALEYFSTYGKAGFNLFRFSQRNCSYPIFTELDRYREDESIATDALLSAARQNGFRVMFGIFGYHDRWTDGRFRSRLVKFVQQKTGFLNEAVDRPGDLDVLNAEKRFVDYCVARWGVYTDFWELLNERTASDEWTRILARHLHSVDPDGKPVGTSWEKPQVAEIDLNTPHWYESEDELTSDTRVRDLAAEWKRYGKPVLVGEQGNAGMNWDPRSGVRMRIRAWAALFQEIGLVFWNTSWSKYGMWEGRYNPGQVANIYLGPEERVYTRALRDFSSRLGSGLQMSPVKVSEPGRVRAYALHSPTQTAAYLHHFATHSSPVRNIVLNLALPRAAEARLRATWIDPSSGKETSSELLSPDSGTINAPPFAVDLAVLIERAF